MVTQAQIRRRGLGDAINVQTLLDDTFSIALQTEGRERDGQVDVDGDGGGSGDGNYGGYEGDEGGTEGRGEHHGEGG